MRQVRPILLAGLVVALGLGTAALGAGPAPRPRPIGEATTALPGPTPGGGFDLPNGWRITPAGQRVADLNDLVLKMVVSPDGADEAPMHRLNEIIWKSVKGPDSPMPPPVHRYRAVTGPES